MSAARGPLKLGFVKHGELTNVMVPVTFVPVATSFIVAMPLPPN